jgi:peptidoglycan hydrolase-like protein with peptidoglycan-binding domain
VSKKSKPVSARKAAANKPARSKSATPKAKATAARKKPKKAAVKSSAKSKAKSVAASARKSRARKAGSTKPTPIERASAASRRPGSAADDSALGSPALAALEAALSGAAPDVNGTTIGGEGQVAAAQAGRAAPRRSGSGESTDGEGHARANKLVPTNAVHTTKRRMKRNGWQAPAMALSALAAVFLILALGQETTPPDVSPLEQRASVAVTDSPMHGSDSSSDGARIADPVQAVPNPAVPPKVPSWSTEAPRKAQTLQEDPMRGLKVLELVEMERILQKLEMGPSQPDGIVDNQTESAIRMYQQIAGLPVNGEPSLELLNDMREVVKMLEPAN